MLLEGAMKQDPEHTKSVRQSGPRSDDPRNQEPAPAGFETAMWQSFAARCAAFVLTRSGCRFLETLSFQPQFPIPLLVSPDTVPISDTGRRSANARGSFADWCCGDGRV